MNYKKIDSSDIVFFKKIVGEKYVLTTKDKLFDYSYDETEDLCFYPEVVIKPDSEHCISKILNYCNTNLIPVTVCGARTGLSGGSLPLKGGVSLSMERLNNIISIDERNLQATVEPGVINQVFREAVEKKNLFYPPDPASKGSCFLGGNVAHNSGGPKALKYGVTRDYVLNLQVVLANGDIVWTGANVLKNSTGYSLTHLMIGSEGTLGVITKIVFRLIPLPKFDITMLVPFYSSEEACKAVSAVFTYGITPSALEFMERDAIDWTIKHSDVKMQIDDKVEAHLLIEVDGNDINLLYDECEKLSKVLDRYSCGEILIADSTVQKDQLWNLRRKVSESVKANSVYKEEDTVVPRAELPKLLLGVKKIGKQYGFKSVCYGHAGDGNLHVNIIKGEMSDNKWNNKLPLAIQEIFKLTRNLGGTISGEHGIGYVQKRYLEIALSKESIEIQKNIKKIFDPNSILNPDKIFN